MTEATEESAGRTCQFRVRRTLVWTGVLVIYSALFIRAESGVASFAFFGLWILAVADSLFGLRKLPLWLVALGVLSVVVVPAVRFVPWPRGRAAHVLLVRAVLLGRGGYAVILLSAWAFAVINHVLGLQKVLLWMGVLGVYCAVFLTFESHPVFVIPFALAILAIAALRTTVAPKLLLILGMIAGAVLWPPLFFARTYRHAVAAELVAGVLLGAVLGIGMVAAAEVAGRIVEWAAPHLSRGANRAGPARSRLQFGLTQMLLVVVLLALPLSWLASELQEKRKNGKVVAWLESLDASYSCRPYNWLESLLRVKRLTSLSLEGTNVGDADMISLRALTNLQWLDLDDTRVTDKGLEYLDSLHSLEDLSLDGTDVTPQGVARLREALPGCQIESAHR